MKPEPLFVAYHTAGPYAGDAALLKLSLDTLGLAHDIREVPTPAGGWSAATQFKAQFVRDRMEENTLRPIVYLDVDCIVIHKPLLFWSIDCDVAATIFPGDELLSGTVYFAPTPAARKIVADWIAENIRSPQTWDQRTLKRVIRANSTALFQQLPYSYTWMVGGQMMTKVKLPDDPLVIVHTRGSLRHNPEHK